MILKQISVYPVKSLKQNDLSTTLVTNRGLRFDRRYMIADPQGNLVSQRDIPELACLQVEASEGNLTVSRDGRLIAEWRHEENREPQKSRVNVWNSAVDVVLADRFFSEAISSSVGQEIRVAYMPEDSQRPVNPIYNNGNDLVSFADGYPILITSYASLSELNSRAGEQIPMRRFRPNFVVDGMKPFEEDQWQKLKIGSTIFRTAKPCARCTVTTIDQDEGAVVGPEPLKTLATFRKALQVFPDSFEAMGLGKNDVLFGATLIPENSGGEIKVGDEVEILS